MTNSTIFWNFPRFSLTCFARIKARKISKRCFSCGSCSDFSFTPSIILQCYLTTCSKFYVTFVQQMLKNVPKVAVLRFIYSYLRRDSVYSNAMHSVLVDVHIWWYLLLKRFFFESFYAQVYVVSIPNQCYLSFKFLGFRFLWLFTAKMAILKSFWQFRTCLKYSLVHLQVMTIRHLFVLYECFVAFLHFLSHLT